MDGENLEREQRLTAAAFIRSRRALESATRRNAAEIA
jgi:hypothetical protein